MKVVDHDRDIQKFELRTSENIKGDTYLRIKVAFTPWRKMVVFK